MTKEQGEALIKYITAALDERMANHYEHHALLIEAPPPAPPDPNSPTEKALADFLALLP